MINNKTYKMHSKEIELQILLPVFNEEKHIEETLEEIHLNLKNTINYQFIISEDGSTDGTKTILNKLKDQYNFILILLWRCCLFYC